MSCKELIKISSTKIDNQGMIKSKYFEINNSRFDKGINLSLLSSCEVLGAS